MLRRFVSKNPPEWSDAFHESFLLALLSVWPRLNLIINQNLDGLYSPPTDGLHEIVKSLTIHTIRGLCHELYETQISNMNNKPFVVQNSPGSWQRKVDDLNERPTELLTSIDWAVAWTWRTDLAPDEIDLNGSGPSSWSSRGPECTELLIERGLNGLELTDSVPRP